MMCCVNNYFKSDWDDDRGVVEGRVEKWVNIYIKHGSSKSTLWTAAICNVLATQAMYKEMSHLQI